MNSILYDQDTVSEMIMRKLGEFLRVCGLCALGFTSVGAVIGGHGYDSVSFGTTCGASSISVASDYGTPVGSIGSDDATVDRLTISETCEELYVALRIIATHEFAAVWFQDYLTRLDAVLSGFSASELTRQELVDLAFQIGPQLRAIHSTLLEEADSSRTWLMLAQKVEPRAESWKVPVRFVRRERETEVARIDWQTLEAEIVAQDFVS